MLSHLHSLGSFSDYLVDVVMEIGPRFFPPPTIGLPTFLVTYPLDALEDEYNFERETNAVTRYDNEHSKKSTVEKLRDREDFTEKTRVTTNNVAKVVEEKMWTKHEGNLEHRTSSVLVPCPIGVISQSSSSHENSITNKSVLLPETLFCYEDFENKGVSPFDLLEMKTIDEKAVLEQVLQPLAVIKTIPTATDFSYNISPELEEQSTVRRKKSQFNDMKICEGRLENTSEPYQQQFLPLSDFIETVAIKASKSSPDLCRFPTISHDSNIQPNQSSRTTEFESKRKSPQFFDENNADSVVLNSKYEISVLRSAVTKKERALIKSLMPMGYSSSLIIECSRKLQTTDKTKIIDCLVLVESLRKNGLDTSLLIDALLNSSMDEDKAKVFARNACQLQSMGFNQYHVVNALREAEGSRDKALELLLAG